MLIGALVHFDALERGAEVGLHLLKERRVEVAGVSFI